MEMLLQVVVIKQFLLRFGVIKQFLLRFMKKDFLRKLIFIALILANWDTLVVNVMQVYLIIIN